MTTPKVSVVMPVYNGEKFVAAAIESVLSQSYTDFELIIINDGSKDSSATIIESYDDPRIVYVANPENAGLAKVRNKGLRIVRGEYIAWLDCDDISLPYRLEKQVRLLDANPNIGLCGTWVKTIGNHAGDIWRYPSEPEFLRARMLFDDPVATSSVMMRAACLQGLKTHFDLDYPPAEDYELWERVSRAWGVTNVPEVLTLYRVHSAQTSIVNAERQRVSIWGIQSRMLAQLGISPTEEEMHLHLDLGAGWNFLPDMERVISSELWLLKLDEANRARQLLPEVAFRRVLAERWFLVVNAVALHGLTAWGVYRRSVLSRWAEKRSWRLVRMFGNCVQRG